MTTVEHLETLLEKEVRVNILKDTISVFADGKLGITFDKDMYYVELPNSGLIYFTLKDVYAVIPNSKPFHPTAIIIR